MNKLLKTFLISLCSLGLLTACNTRKEEESSKEQQPSSSEREDPHDRDPDDPYRVLFLGNSLIFFNDMPKMFEDLCIYDGIPMQVDSVTQGSCTMSLLATTQTSIGLQAYKKLTEETWDYVIIEPSRRATPFEDSIYEAELEAAVVLDQLAQDAGAETLIYSVWGLNKGETGVYQQVGYDSIKTGTHAITRSAHCNYMNWFGEKVSEKLGGRQIIKAGYAFENSIATFPSTNIYYTDDQHPNATGSYLVACTIFDTMFGLESSGLDYKSTVPAQTAANMQSVADMTVVNGLVPTLDPIPDKDDPIEPEEEFDQTVLFVGAPTIMRDDYKAADNFVALMDNLGKKVRVIGVYDSSYTMKMMATNGSTKNSELRAALGTYQFDQIVLQISRRATLHSTDVTAAETSYCEALKDLLHSETDNIFIFAPKGEASQYTFSNTGDNYTKGSKKETATNAEMCQYYSDLAVTMANKIDGKAIKYASAYREYAEDYTQNKEGVGYLYQCCFYNSFFNKAIPDTCTWNNGVTDENAAILRGIAAKYCLPQA